MMVLAQVIKIYMRNWWYIIVYKNYLGELSGPWEDIKIIEEKLVVHDNI